jgi:hypothetical protein
MLGRLVTSSTRLDEFPTYRRIGFLGSLGECAIVIGGSLAGLMTARVFADHFTHVFVLERDNIEDNFAVHKSVP